MFKGFQNTKKSNSFNGFPNLNFQMNNEAYGFSGCTFWLDAAYGLNTQTDLAAVSEWTDRIRNIKFTQSTAGNQPRFDLSNPSFNNLPSIEFQDGFRTISSADGINTGNSMTLAFVVQKIGNSGGGRNQFLFLSSGSSDLGNIKLRRNVAGNGIGVYDADTPIVNSGVDDTNPHIVVIRTGDSGGAAIFVDGVKLGTGTWSISTRWLTIGWLTGTNGLFAHLGELLIFNSSFSDTNCNLLSDNINSKYAIY